MWTGVSGLLGHGERMNVIGNNIANVNTVGFKSQRMDFADFVYQDSFSLAGMTQIGRGVRIGAVMGEFGQGSFETTTETTDLAIGGNGFFRVEPIGSETAYYTRAGNFRFNDDGYLVDPNGYCVQGWKVDNTTGPTRASGGMSTSIEDTTSSLVGSGSPTDVRLDTWTVDPLQTTKVSMMVNLSKDKGADKAQDVNNPFSAMLEKWNGKQPQTPNVPYIAEDNYSYQTSIDVYDEAGGTHTLTVYFDKISNEDYEGPINQTMWEYIVTMDPAEDMRQVSNAADNYKVINLKDTSAAGLLMAGTLTFDSAGRLENQSAYTLYGNKAPTDKDGKPTNGFIELKDEKNNPYYVPTVNVETAPGPDQGKVDIASWMYPTAVSGSGFPMLVANFTGLPGAQTAGTAPDADKYLMEIDFGLKVSDYENPWGNNEDVSLAAANRIAKDGNPFDVDKKDTNPHVLTQLATIKPPTYRQSNAFTSYKGSHSTQTMSQNGYGFGNLSNYTVDSSGVLYGIYSNGVNLPLYQLTLYDFTCKQGLRREGNNLFSQTRDSGDPSSGVAGTGLFGTVNANTLEGSNVDLSTEFVRMITTQRGFQSNSKVVTTTDTMLETVINMKR